MWCKAKGCVISQMTDQSHFFTTYRFCKTWCHGDSKRFFQLHNPSKRFRLAEKSYADKASRWNAAVAWRSAVRCYQSMLCLIRDGNIDKVTQLVTDGGTKKFLEKFYFVVSSEVVGLPARDKSADLWKLKTMSKIIVTRWSRHEKIINFDVC